MDEMDFVAAATGKRLVALFALCAVSICLPVLLMSCGTLAFGYTLVCRNCVTLKLLLDSNGLSSDMLGHSSRRKLL